MCPLSRTLWMLHTFPTHGNMQPRGPIGRSQHMVPNFSMQVTGQLVGAKAVRGFNRTGVNRSSDAGITARERRVPTMHLDRCHNLNQ
jgi:hypothetical protein